MQLDFVQIFAVTSPFPNPALTVTPAIFLLKGYNCLVHVLKPLGCKSALGMANHTITDAQISASSQHNDRHAAIHGRLHFQAAPGKAGAWSALTNNDSQWLQIDLINQYVVTRVATQGRNDSDEWVTSYRLQYNKDSANFKYYKEQGQTNYKVKYYIQISVTS